MKSRARIYIDTIDDNNEPINSEFMFTAWYDGKLIIKEDTVDNTLEIVFDNCDRSDSNK